MPKPGNTGTLELNMRKINNLARHNTQENPDFQESDDQAKQAIPVMQGPKIDWTFLPKVTNRHFYGLYFDTKRYLVLVGGGGSGKSVFAASKVIYRAMSEARHRILVLRKVKETLRDSVFEELKDCIYRWGFQDLWKIPKGRSSELYLRCLNGSEIIFSGLDDVEKLKSIKGVTMVWIEEASEIDEQDFSQIDIRFRGKMEHYKQIILSFNPIYRGHWLETHFVKEDWTPRLRNCTVHHSTYKNNRFLDRASIAVLEGFKKSDPYYYMVYALGQWGVFGQTIFPAELVSMRIAALQNQEKDASYPGPILARGHFAFEYTVDTERNTQGIDDQSIRWIDDPFGPIEIYEYPEEGVCYCAGCDTAGDGSDYFAASVLNVETKVQVAVLHNQYDEDDFAKQMYCLGKFYNEALLAIEANFSTFPIRELQRLGYVWQWKRERIDQISKKKEYRFGWMTTGKSRPLAIALCVKFVKENVDCINDLKTLQEMLTFVRNEKGRAEAMEGKHDDLIMSLAIAIAALDQAAHTAEGSFLAGGIDKRAMTGRKKRIENFDADYDDEDEDDEVRERGYWAV